MGKLAKTVSPLVIALYQFLFIVSALLFQALGFPFLLGLNLFAFVI